MAEAAEVPALGRRCAVGHGGTGGKQKRYLATARSESFFGWEKVYTESCTQLCKEMKEKKPLGVGRNSATKADFHVSALCAVGSRVQIGSCLWWRSTPSASGKAKDDEKSQRTSVALHRGEERPPSCRPVISVCSVPAVHLEIASSLMKLMALLMNRFPFVMYPD